MLESLVRPFQTPQVTPVRFLNFNVQNPLPPGIVECKLGGSGGRTTSFTLNGVGFVVKDNDEKYKEVDRKSTLVKVENEDDPEQFVEICRADRLNFKSKKDEDSKYRQTGYTAGQQQGQGNDDKARQFDMQYPDERTCQPKTKPPKGGNC